jgi:hypothetical protein
MLRSNARGSLPRIRRSGRYAARACCWDSNPLGAGARAANARAKRIVNTAVLATRRSDGLGGPARQRAEARPPLTFRRQHADLLVEAIDATLSAEPTAEGR